MHFSHRSIPPKPTAFTAAAMHKLHAVALWEPTAANAPFQRSQANLPPTQNVNTAVSLQLPAGQFSGSNAKYAKNAATIAIFATF